VTERRWRLPPTPWVVAAVVLLSLLFALQGGEYSTWNWLQLRSEEKAERAALAGLQHEVDSLQKLAVAIERDPRLQERIARESFGMIRKGEYLYRLVPEEGEPGTGNGER
jgi:cell division protein FtsB